MLKTFVKIGNITNLSDARYCAGMGVDMLGFPIAEAMENRLPADMFQEITNWVQGPTMVGEFGNASLEEIKTAVLSYDLDAIETDNMDIVESVQLLGKPVIFRHTIDSEEALSKLRSKLSYLDELAKVVIINSSNPEMFAAIDDAMCYYGGNLRLIKSYGITAENALDLAAFKGIELTGTPEDRPGFKDYGQVMDVLESLEED